VSLNIQHEPCRHGRRLLMWKVVQAWDLHRPTFCPFKTLKPLIALRSAHTVLSVCLVKQLKCLCKMFTKFAAKFHTHTHTHTHARTFFKLFHCHFVTNPTNCAQFSGCNSTTNARSETGQMAVCCQNLTLGAFSSRSALCVLVGALFKEFGLFLNMPRTRHITSG